MTPLWRVELADGIAVATYDHPPVNYMTTRGFDELAVLVEGWFAPEVRAVVLTGRPGGAFVTHFSVEEIVARLDGAARHPARPPSAVFQRINDLPKPVVAAINGDCMGGGLELALACDLRVAQRGDFRIGLPEVRLGIIPGAGGTQRLSRLLGVGAALDLLLRARVLTPDEAHAAGLVQEIADDALAGATAIARQIAALPPAAVAAAKAAVHGGAALTLDAGIRVEADAARRAKLSPDAAVALRSYLALPVEGRRAWLDADR